MYNTKARFPCRMPSDALLRVLALNASLKHEPTISNTGELATLVLDEIRALATIQDRDKRLKNMATMHMAKGLAQNLVYHARLLKAHPQEFVPGHATCCERHAGLEAPV
jgi:hypothetical protein